MHGALSHEVLTESVFIRYGFTPSIYLTGELPGGMAQGDFHLLY
jgi:hypothetical protein